EVVPGDFVAHELGVCRIAGDVLDLKAHLHVLLGVVIDDLAERCGHDAADNALSIVCNGIADVRLAEVIGDVHPVPALGLPAFNSSSYLFLLCHNITCWYFLCAGNMRPLLLPGSSDNRPWMQ